MNTGTVMRFWKKRCPICSRFASVWKESFSEKHQKKFWKNKETGETTWKDPTGTSTQDNKKKSSKSSENNKSETDGTDAVEKGPVKKKSSKESAVAVDTTSAASTDWVQGYSEKKKAPYWKNKVTGESTWKDPTISTNKAEEGTVTNKAVSSEWTAHYSEKHQKPYWKNTTTGKSTFTNPNNSSTMKETEKASSTETATYNPEEWEEKYDKKKEKKYWKNKTTGKATYSDPSKATSSTLSNTNSSSNNKETTAVAVEWEEKYSEKHKKKYWKNKITNATTWSNPNTTTAGNTTTSTAASNSDMWEEKYDKKSNRKYWKNKETGKSTFKDPTASTTTIEKNKSDEVSVQSGTTTIATVNHSSDWVEKFSEKHNKKYWKNKETGKTSWTPPPPSTSSSTEVVSSGSNMISKEVESTATTAAAAVWVESYSEKYKRTCWKNTTTNKTTYTKPLNWSPPTTTETGNSTTVSSSNADTATMKAVINLSYSTALTESDLTQQTYNSSNSNSSTTYERRLLQLRYSSSTTSSTTGSGSSMNDSIELDILKFTSECLQSARLRAAPSSSSDSTAVSKTEVVRSFRLHSIRSLLCNQTAGVVSIVLPPGAVIEAVPQIPVPTADVTSAPGDSEKPHVAPIAAAPAQGVEGIATTTAATTSFDKFDHINEPAVSATTRAAETATAAVEETPSVAAMYCLLHLHFANVRTAQAWYRLIVQRLNLSEGSEAAVSETTTTLPVVYDYTAKEVTLPTEEEDRLLGVYTLAAADAVLHQLETEWLYPAHTPEHHLHTTMQSIVTSQHSLTSPITQPMPLPTCGLLLFKILTVHEYSTDTDQAPSPIAPGSDSTTAQMKGWISCYIRVDTASNTISFYDQGLQSPPSLSVSCESATLHVPELTNPEIGYECNLYHCNIINQAKKSKISIAIKLHNQIDLFMWMLTLSRLIENVTYSNSGSVHAVTMIDYLQDTSRSYTRSTAATAMNICCRPYITDICMSIVESLAERKMCSSYMRTMQLTGIQLKSTRFLHINQRIVLLIKGNNNHLTEGSVLLSINGLSTLTAPASTILKFIQDLPRNMIADLTIWKFPRKEFQVKMVKLNVIQDINSNKNNTNTSSNTNIPSTTTTENNTDQYSNNTSSTTTNYNHQLDSKSKLNRVILQKRNSILKAGSGLDVTFEGIEHPAIIEGLQRELQLLDVNASSISRGGSNTTTISNSNDKAGRVIENLKKEKEDGGFTIADYTNKPTNELRWSNSRVMIASGNVTFLLEDQITLYRIQLSSCELKLVLPSTATCAAASTTNSSSGSNISTMGLHLCDHKTSVVLQCASLELLLDLAESLLVAMKMHGAYSADMGYLYDQAVYWHKTTTSTTTSVAGSSKGSTTNRITTTESSSIFSRSQSLLVQSIQENTQKKKEFSQQETVTSFSDTMQNPSTTSSGSGISGSDVESNILVAAEELESILSSLQLPINFPTHTTIEKEVVELFKINNSNHRLLAEFLTLQFDAMHPVSEAVATASVVSRSKSFSNYMPTNQDLLRGSDERSSTSSGSAAETKYPLLSNSDASQSSEKAAVLEEKGTGEGSSSGSSSSEAVLREKLFAAITGSSADSDTGTTAVTTATAEEKKLYDHYEHDKEHEVPKVLPAGPSDETNSSLPQPPSPSATTPTLPTTRRTSIQMRSGSVMMSTPTTPAMSTHTANRRATFRKSAITHSQEQAAVLLMSKMEKQIMLQSVLTKTDRQAISVLLNHLRASPPDLINIAMRFTSATDVKGLAHFIVHRLCVYWSAEQRQLEDIVCAAAVAESSQYQKNSRHSGQLVQSSVRDHNSTTTHTSISFLQTLLDEISTRLDVVVYIQSLCEGISIESLTEDSGVSDLCARVVEPFCRRFEAAVVLNTMPISLKHTICALVKCQDSNITPYDFLSTCMLPHILNAIVEQNKYASSNLDVCLSDVQLETILDRVRELVGMCLSQDAVRHRRVCLSDQAALSRSKWFIERSLQYILHTTQSSTSSSSQNAATSPIARLAGIELCSGKSTAMQGLICLRPSELFFILQSMELTNISAAPLSAYSRELSQAIAHMHSSDLLQRLHSELRLTPLSGHTPSAQLHDRELTGTGILDALNETGVSFLDREVTFLLYITPHAVYNNEFMPHFNDETTVPVVVPSVKGFNSSHNGAGASSIHSTASSIYSTTSSAELELSSLLTSESVEESVEAHSLASIRWLIQAARSALKSLYEHNHSSNIIKSYSTIQELQELSSKLLSRKDEIMSILADWKKIAICIELCTNYKAQISLLMEKYKFQKKLLQQNEHSPVFWNSHGVNSTDTASNIYDSAPSTVSLLAANEQIAAAMANKEKEIQSALSQIILLQLQLESELQKNYTYDSYSGSAAGTNATTSSSNSSSRPTVSSPTGARSQSKLASLAAALSPHRVQSHNNNNSSNHQHTGTTSTTTPVKTGWLDSMDTTSTSSTGSPLLLRSRAPNPLHVVMKSVFNHSSSSSSSSSKNNNYTSPRKL